MMKFLLYTFLQTLIATYLIAPDTFQVNALDNLNVNGTNATTESVTDALETSKIILESIGNFIHETLVPVAFNEGVQILDDTKKYLANCEILLKSIENISEYYDCAKPELAKAMAALSALQSKYHLLQIQTTPNTNNKHEITSGAATLKLFWL